MRRAAIRSSAISSAAAAPRCMLLVRRVAGPTSQRCRCTSTATGAASVSRLRRPGGSSDEVLLVGVGAAAHPQLWQAEVTALLRDAEPNHVVLQLAPGQPAADGGDGSETLLRDVDAIIEQVIKKGTFGLGSLPPGAGMRAYTALFWVLGLSPQREMAGVREAAAALELPLVRGDAPTAATMAALGEALTMNELQSMLKAADSAEGRELLKLNQSLAAALPTPPAMETDASVAAFLQMIGPLQKRPTITALTTALKKVAPKLATVVIDARDHVMVSRLLELEGPTVAVVGLAHMDGMEKLFEEAGGKVTTQMQ